MFGKGGEEEVIRRPAIHDPSMDCRKSKRRIKRKGPLSDHGEEEKSRLSNELVATTGLICPLPSCNRLFHPRKKEEGGKVQRFDSPECRSKYFTLVKKVGDLLVRIGAVEITSIEGDRNAFEVKFDGKKFKIRSKK
jgi:hypothetical protein